MKLKMLARSDSGTTRTANEDFCGIFEEDGLAIVCDGMGGHKAGANASRLAVKTIRYIYLFLDPSVHFRITQDLLAKNLNIASRLVGSIRLANRNVYNKSSREQNLKGMGTTVSALAIYDDVAVIAHVGDSRIYRIRQNMISLLTEDHTWINELIQDQEIDKEEAKKFEKQNVITRALGLSGSIKIDVGIEPVQQGDLFLICTDGLTKALSDEEIKRIVLFNNGNLDHTLQHLIDTAMMKDGSDNITVALAAIEQVDSVNTLYQPLYLTLPDENKQTTYLEDKILKRELYNRTNSESVDESFSKLFKKKYGKLTWIAGILIVVIFVGVYAFSDHAEKHNSKLVKNYQLNTQDKNQPDNLIQIPSSKNNPVNDLALEQLAKLENRPLPDSVTNKLIKSSLDNQENIVQVSKIRSRPLPNNFGNRGKIYLTGLEKFPNIEKTTLFINDTYWGKTRDFGNKGVLLPPGTYTIIIRDSTETALFQQKNIEIIPGDIKLIEIKGR